MVISCSMRPPLLTSGLCQPKTSNPEELLKAHTEALGATDFSGLDVFALSVRPSTKPSIPHKKGQESKDDERARLWRRLSKLHPQQWPDQLYIMWMRFPRIHRDGFESMEWMKAAIRGTPIANPLGETPMNTARTSLVTRQISLASTSS
jgi:hypothetical protein